MKNGIMKAQNENKNLGALMKKLSDTHGSFLAGVLFMPQTPSGPQALNPLAQPFGSGKN